MRTKAELMTQIATLHSLCKSLSIPIADDDGNEMEPALLMLRFATNAARFAGAMMVAQGIVSEDVIRGMHDSDVRGFVQMMSGVIMSSDPGAGAPETETNPEGHRNVIPFPTK